MWSFIDQLLILRSTFVHLDAMRSNNAVERMANLVKGMNDNMDEIKDDLDEIKNDIGEIKCSSSATHSPS